MYLDAVMNWHVRRLALVASVGVFGCGPKVGGEGDTESTSAEDGDGDGDGDGGGDGDGDGDGDGADDSGDGGPAFGGNCSSLPADGPTIGPEGSGPTGYPIRCNPRTQSGDGAYMCCSDDPAAAGGALPAYDGKGINGDIPLFSGANNDLGTWGVCVKTEEIPAGTGLAEPAAANCPVPCNPTWDAASITAVCGDGRVCCQTQELQPSDCVQDVLTGEYRAVTGLDIGVSNPDGSVVTDWSQGAHATHQDPSGAGCLQFSGGSEGPAFEDCVAQLSVADQRGFCMALGAGQTCPLDQPSYIDACEALNM